MYCGVFVGNCFRNVAEGVEKLTFGLPFANARSNLLGVGSIEAEHPNAMMANMTDTKIKANFNTYSESLFRYIIQISNMNFFTNHASSIRCTKIGFQSITITVPKVEDPKVSLAEVLVWQ